MTRITPEAIAIAREHQLESIYHSLTQTDSLALIVDKYIDLKKRLPFALISPVLPHDKSWILNREQKFGFNKLYDIQFADDKLSASLGQFVQEEDTYHDTSLALCFKPRLNATHFINSKMVLAREDITGSLALWWQGKLKSTLGLDAENCPLIEDFVIAIKEQDAGTVTYSVYLKIPNNDSLYFLRLLRNCQINAINPL